MSASLMFFLGKPASGKGTQIRRIIQSFGGVSFSTGDSLKAHINKGTDIGKKVKAIIAEGMLVSDEIVFEIFADFHTQSKDHNKFLLIDGFPRTVKQFQLVAAFAQKNAFKCSYLNFNVDDDTIISRFQGRLVCNTCFAPFSVLTSAAKEQDICPACTKGMLIKRVDDNLETVKKRLIEYQNLTAPMIKLIAETENDCYFEFNASKSEQEIFSEVERLLLSPKFNLKKIH